MRYLHFSSIFCNLFWGTNLQKYLPSEPNYVSILLFISKHLNIFLWGENPQHGCMPDAQGNKKICKWESAGWLDVLSANHPKRVAAVFHLRKTWVLMVLQDFRDTSRVIQVQRIGSGMSVCGSLWLLTTKMEMSGLLTASLWLLCIITLWLGW